MIRLTGQITYNDGRTIEVEAGQAEIAAWEVYALRQGFPAVDVTGGTMPALPATMVRYLGYAAAHKGKPKTDWDSFDDWEAQVADVDLKGEGDAGDAATQVFPQVRSAG